MAQVKKILAWTGVIFFVLFIIGMFAQSGKRSDSSKVQATNYNPSQKEKKVIDYMLQDEVSTFSDGGESFLLGKDTPSVSAIDVEKAYKDNQVAADQKYYKKALLVSGIISSINSGIGNEPYVVLKGYDPFLSPQLHFQRNNVENIANLKKGQDINVVCEGAGAVVGTAIFNDCQFAVDYAGEKISTIKSDINDFLSGEKLKSDLIAKAVILSIAIGRELPDNSSCLTTDKNCAQDISAASSKGTTKEKISAVSSELKSLGIQVPSKEMEKKN